MVITKIVAGLGNQMFQYAVGKRTALATSSTLKLDLSWFRENTIDTKRDYLLNIFRIQENLATKTEINRLKGPRGTFLERVFSNRFPTIYTQLLPGSQSYFLENSFSHFEPEVLKIKGDAYLEGWWQTEKYFLDITDIIRHDFSFKRPPDKVNRDLLSQIRKTNSVSAHIRRGDYINNKNYSQFFVSCSPQYYKKGVEKIARKIKSPTIFVFSDDPRWVRQNIKFNHKTIYVTGNLGKKDYEDLRLMAACQHNIIANSSFSWWGAWLNPNPDKIVIAPKKWVNDPKIDITNKVPQSWIKV